MPHFIKIHAEKNYDRTKHLSVAFSFPSISSLGAAFITTKNIYISLPNVSNGVGLLDK